MLRNRRRSRYGVQLCAITAAILLLLSVSVLHSRLGFDRQSSSSSLERTGIDFSQDSDDIDAIVVNPLLEDIQNDATTASTTNSGTTTSNEEEDRIDELDVIDTDDQSKVSDEEEILRGVDFEEESDSDLNNNKFKHSPDYVWDHIVGVTRRAFDKRSIHPWQDSVPFGSYSSSSNSEDDKSKIAFGSDDQPVDENVRRKLDHIRVIEDALLLKTSPLREGWANWFEKKGDFLRRDKMFKSNLENLNPMNNPLLQDPDGVGVTTLTRGDKIMHKALLNEFRKLPVVVKNPFFGNNVKERDANVDEMKVNKDRMINQVKGVERRTLDDNGSSNSNDGAENLGSIERVIAGYENSNSHSNDERKLHLPNGKEPLKLNVPNGKVNVDSGPIYADGSRWGYFPGLPPHLSFTDFVTEFFRQGKCSLQVFMIWNSPPWMFSVRHQRGLESLLYHHPDACVMVFSETIELDFFRDFVKDGFRIAVAMPNLDELLENTPTHEFVSAWFEWRKTNFYPVHYSELIRLAALYKFGGLYLDSDIVVLKPLASVNNFVSMEDQLGNGSFTGAAMAFKKSSPFIMKCLKEYYETYDDTLLRWNGGELLERVGKQSSSINNSSNKQLDTSMQPSSLFFSVGRKNITRYFNAPADETERAEQDILFRRILKESYIFHFWNSVTSTIVPDPGSLVWRILNHFCIRCLDVL
ncbi:uncharacterized protein At4g19900-like [Papaver somniferum]|uniref:uncharacterized protein At4g19900-like n=1 Tax=Papaver somniferum TaxID=3469 RepID=UPI000E6F951D|nr:uncharacterized protein At4g19900-like [Papaver somniferum]